MPKIAPRANVDVLAYKVDSFDTAVFCQDIMSFSEQSIILGFNQKGVYPINLPKNGHFNNLSVNFFSLNKKKLDYLISPLIFLIDYARIGWLFLLLMARWRPKRVIVENTYVAAWASILRRLGLAKKMIYLPGDWLAGNAAKRGIWSYVGNNIVFVWADYIACRNSDLTINYTEAMSKARKTFWKKEICRNEVIFQNRLMIKSAVLTPTKQARKIAFIGTVRHDSGLDWVMRLLPKLKEEFGISMKIIGLPAPELELLAAALKLTNVIEFTGFLDRDSFKDALSDCFCGINLITTQDSYTSKTLPAKIYDYMQYLLPVIVSPYVGPVADLIRRQRLGLVMDLNEKDFMVGVSELYRAQTEYRERIKTYIEFTGKNTLKDFLA
ncbi:MAG: hypothetical protein COX96_08040 [Candidatus Omnitrophica bacterium CG_4_10_14_0_2_um_filter_44_9]|nr:MAG: hypothetical protein COY78_03620 [Candidatus Omnitrophica bacterium CG_4_10_14_0_8_um_filter_44_12]PIZ83365.1 MAG: hypothetical protein COX96_08040 [Candidatus Omnitrophica bacterium CG_4_10_14_0_2_um_filter_44_9]